jgi:hypothetical protein
MIFAHVNPAVQHCTDARLVISRFEAVLRSTAGCLVSSRRTLMYCTYIRTNSSRQVYVGCFLLQAVRKIWWANHRLDRRPGECDFRVRHPSIHLQAKPPATCGNRLMCIASWGCRGIEFFRSVACTLFQGDILRMLNVLSEVVDVGIELQTITLYIQHLYHGCECLLHNARVPNCHHSWKDLTCMRFSFHTQHVSSVGLPNWLVGLTYTIQIRLSSVMTYTPLALSSGGRKTRST